MFFLLQACTLFSEINADQCQSTSDCVDTFGMGHTCQSDGYCSVIEPISRCTTTNPPDFWDDPSAYEGAFVIGQMFDFTADASKLAASELAFNDILETGSNGTWLNGRKLVQITCNYENNAGDTLTEKDAVETVTDFLVNTLGVEVIVGPAGSQDSLYATNLSDGKALFISPSATAEALKPENVTYTDENPGLFWRTTGPDRLQSKALLNYLDAATIDTFAILYQNSLYGSGIGNGIRDAREGSTGIAPAIDVFEVNALSTIGRKINELLVDDTVQALIFVSDNTDDIMEAIKAMRSSSHENVKLLLTDAAAKTEMLEKIREYTGNNETQMESIGNQVIGTKPTLPDSEQFETFQARLEEQYNLDASSSAFAAHTYDATWLGVTALMYADANEDPHDIQGLARGLRKVSALEEPINLSTAGWNEIVTKLSANEPVNIEGASGKLDYNLETEETTTPVDLWKFIDNLLSFEIIDLEDITIDAEDTGDTDTQTDTGVDTDTGTDTTGFSVDTITVQFHHGFDGSNLVNMAYTGHSLPVDGYMTIRLTNSANRKTCELRWIINPYSITLDSVSTMGGIAPALVEDSNSSALNIPVWYGYIIQSSPTMSTTCIEFDETGQEIINDMTNDSPGFAYSYVDPNLPVLHNAMANHPAGWANIEQTVMAGMVSFTAFSGTGMRHYYPINQTFIYKPIDNQTHFNTTWDPSDTNIPQVSASATINPNPSGYYVSEPYFNFTAPLQ